MQIIFSIYDHKVSAFGSPFFAPHRGGVIREFCEVCLKKDHMYNKHPHDFELFELGKFDEITGKILNHDSPISLGSAASFIGKVDYDQVSLNPTNC